MLFVALLNLFETIFEFLHGSKKMTVLKKVVEANQHYGNGFEEHIFQSKN